MQAIESQNLILYQTDLRGQWPEPLARAFATRLPYVRRLALRSMRSADRASLAGIALALRALSRVLARSVQPGEIVFAAGAKPHLALPAALVSGEAPARGHHARRAASSAVDFSISHSGPWVACAALTQGRVGLDLEMGTDERIAEWVMLEAALKASGQGLRALTEVARLSVHEGRLCWRGDAWHVRHIGGFEGASACVVCSREVATVETHAIGLAELFAS